MVLRVFDRDSQNDCLLWPTATIHLCACPLKEGSHCVFLVPLTISSLAMGFVMGFVVSPLVCLIEQQVSSNIYTLCGLQIRQLSAQGFTAIHAVIVSQIHDNYYTSGKYRFGQIPELSLYFKRIGELRALVDVPFMALTASAPPLVESDIIQTLHLSSPLTVLCSFIYQQAQFVL